MNEFSKQYCDRYDPEMPSDFDLDELYAQIQNGESVPVICDGFGFTHIHKTDEGIKQVVFTNYEEEGDDYKFIDLDEIDRKTYSRIFNEVV